MGIDVSHSPCIGHRNKGNCFKGGNDTQGRFPWTEEKRGKVGSGIVRSNLFFGEESGYIHADQPGMGRMDDGVPERMDGKRIWGIEPPSIPRLCIDVKDRSKRLKTLGNAVVPAQVYPILRYIADIETGKCARWCVWGDSV